MTTPLVLLAALTVGLAQPAAAAPITTPPGSARFSATFIQLWADHWNWPQARWQETFRYYRSLGLKEIYVQWTVYDAINYYSPGVNPLGAVGQAGKTAPVSQILQLAGESGMAVHLGLAFHSGFWQNAKPGPQLAGYMADQYRRSAVAAAELARLYGRERAFAGFYISEELDDLMWPAGQPRDLLVDHFSRLSTELERLAPGKAITISGYGGARTEPARLQTFWTDLLARTRFTTVMFQDGIGVGNLPLAYLRQYLDAMKQAAEQTQKELRVIVETFRQVDGEFNGRSFRAIPAPFPLLLPQMQVAAPYSAGGLVAFTVSDYLSPMGGDDAARGYQSYLDWMLQSL
ncbi:MAG: DUF4434 domain-containing protein [Acidobacteria bacterium]|nr:DUF4434 domain-containing protein [Acidobacteriota bacterium]